MSRFPRLSETFVLFEMNALTDAGVDVELFPLIRERSDVEHPEAAPWVRAMRYQRALGLQVLRSNLRRLVRNPRTYLGTLGAVVRGTWRSANFLFGGLAAFPKVVHYAGEMEELGVDHLHCHFASHPALAGFVVHRLTGIPFSFTAHGSDLHVDQTMLPAKVAEAAFVVAVSDYNRRMIIDECDGRFADRVQVVHCGVDTDVFEPLAASTATDRLHVVCVGTLHEVKGQAHLIRAIAHSRAAGVDVALTMVGDGEDRGALERLVTELDLDTAVTFTGRQTRGQIVDHLRDADVMVAPSVPTAGGKREGIPVVIMEGMASGLPVVSSRLSGIPELVDDGVTGILTEPGDDAAIGAALATLARSPEMRASMGAAGRARVVADFDLATNARRLLDTIEAHQQTEGER